MKEGIAKKLQWKSQFELVEDIRNNVVDLESIQAGLLRQLKGMNANLYNMRNQITILTRKMKKTVEAEEVEA